MTFQSTQTDWLSGFSQLNVAGLVNVAGNMFNSRQAAISATRQANAIADAASIDFSAFQDRVQEIGKATMENVGVRAQQSMREMGRLQSILADSGTAGGNTSQRLRAELRADAAQDTAAIQANGRSQVRQTGRQIQATALGASSRVDAISNPSGWGTLMSNMGGLFDSRKTSVTVGDVMSGAATTKRKA